MTKTAVSALLTAVLCLSVIEFNRLYFTSSKIMSVVFQLVISSKYRYGTNEAINIGYVVVAIVFIFNRCSLTMNRRR